MRLSARQDTPCRRSVAELSNIHKVTVPVMVYVALIVSDSFIFVRYISHINRHDIH
jgi:cell division protein FtsL